ncbi:MAG: hypothetical protein WAR79_01540 [Melioribacteraceae bacterium]
MFPVTLEFLTEAAKKVNSSKEFRMGFRKKDLSFWISYKGKKLFPMNDDMPIILTRQDGYHLKISELFQTELELQSAETNNHGELYHNNFYFFTNAISPSRVNVCIKYFDVPENNVSLSPSTFLMQVQQKVEKNPNMLIVPEPFGPISYDIKLIPNGLKYRPKIDWPFCFEVELDAITYGDVMLKVDKIVHDLEN